MFVASVIQHAMRIRRIILSSVVCPASYFSTLSQKGTIFGKKFRFSVRRLSETFPILRRIQRDVTDVQGCVSRLAV